MPRGTRDRVIRMELCACRAKRMERAESVARERQTAQSHRSRHNYHWPNNHHQPHNAIRANCTNNVTNPENISVRRVCCRSNSEDVVRNSVRLMSIRAQHTHNTRRPPCTIQRWRKQADTYSQHIRSPPSSFHPIRSNPPPSSSPSLIRPDHAPHITPHRIAHNTYALAP